VCVIHVKDKNYILLYF